jgi:hypothetical protein
MSESSKLPREYWRFFSAAASCREYVSFFFLHVGLLAFLSVLP